MDLLHVAVFVRRVPDPASLEVDPLTGLPDLERSVIVTSPADLGAVEAALGVREERGGEVTAVAVGPPDVEAALQECLGMGVDHGVRVWGNGWSAATPAGVAALALAGFLKDRFELILWGDGGDSLEVDEVPFRVAEELRRPLVTAVTRWQMGDDGRSMRLWRRLERGRRQLVETTAPALWTVGPLGTAPRPSRLRLGPVQGEVTFVALDLADRLLPETEDWWYGQGFDRGPLRPEPKLIFTPDQRLPARERITQLISGGLVDKGGLMVQGSAEEAAEAIIRFLADRGFLAGIL